jgi:hypothetical protein
MLGGQGWRDFGGRKHSSWSIHTPLSPNIWACNNCRNQLSLRRQRLTSRGRTIVRTTSGGLARPMGLNIFRLGILCRGDLAAQWYADRQVSFGAKREGKGNDVATDRCRSSDDFCVWSELIWDAWTAWKGDQGWMIEVGTLLLPSPWVLLLCFSGATRARTQTWWRGKHN